MAALLAPLVRPHPQLPTLFVADAKAERRFFEFFTAHLANDHTRKAYLNAVKHFAAWCELQGLTQLATVQPIHIAAYIQTIKSHYAAPTVKQHLAAIRMLFDWLVVGHVIDVNPAHAVRAPKHSVKKGKTPVLTSDEARELLDSIDTATLIGLRDRALIGLMVYTFARVGAAIHMKVEDYFIQGRRGWVRLHEKGGKLHTMPCHHNLDQYLEAYIAGAGLNTDPQGILFRTAAGKTGKLTTKAMSQKDVHRMIGKRAATAAIKTKIGCHTFRATGITAYLKNGGRLEIAQQMANHESSKTTSLYDRRGDEISLDEVERIVI
jgi:site-specific recombinase XerD